MTTAATRSRTFLPTGAEQTFVVPAGVTALTVTATGGRGGQGAGPGAVGGAGGRVTATIPVTPGSTWAVLRIARQHLDDAKDLLDARCYGLR